MAQTSTRLLEIKAPQPFVKWAGGKSQLIHRLSALAPAKFERYFEPFVGGGALFFHLRPRRALISDSNFELINTYRVIRNHLSTLLQELKRLSEQSLSEPLFKRYRSIDPDSLPPVKRAARLIFLNKTCYNGLYRVNKSGDFNVPFGKYEHMPQLCNEENLKQVSRLLQSIELMCADFEIALDKAKSGDFVYLDPPYAPTHNSPSFTSFTKEDFTESDQRRLAELFRELDRRGCFLMLSNSDSRLTHELYSGFKSGPVSVDRMINCIGSRRTGFKELVILNYEPSQPSLSRWLID